MAAMQDAAGPASAPPPASGPNSATPSKGRILVVDDDRLVLATVAHGLAQAGYEVIDADNGDDAILLAREHRPQLALLDIRMEGKSGFDVAATLRDAYRIPFMFLSAFSDDATVAEVQRLGALAYLVKPLDVGQIVPGVEAAFARIRTEPGLGGSAPAAAPAARDSLADEVALAVGVLMHRHALTRTQAFARLQRMAAELKISAQAQAERLLGAVEELARSGE